MAKVGSNVIELRVLEQILNTANGIFLASSYILVYVINSFNFLFLLGNPEGKQKPRTIYVNCKRKLHVYYT